VTEPRLVTDPHGSGAVVPSTARRGAARLLPARLPYSLLGIAVGLAGWELGVRLAHVPRYVLPPFSDAVATAVTERSYLLGETWVTVQEIVLGFLLSLGVGISLAVLIVTVKPVGKAIFPLLVASQVVPKIAIAPVFLVWFGFGMGSKTLIAFLLSFFPIVIDTVLGLRSTKLETLYLARSMGAGWWPTFLHVRIPNALPHVFSGLKLAATFAVTGAIIGEFVGSDRGVGRAILVAGAGQETNLVFAGVLYISAIGFGAFLLMEYLESVVVSWHVSQRRRHPTARGTA
jgi:NitT/TauT family transport system permease protein